MGKAKPRLKREVLSSRERFLIAMRRGIPDRVPVTPDFSNMIPCRLTGKPFWDIYLHNRPQLWRAYIAAADYFGIDAWFFYGGLDFQYEDTGCRWEHKLTAQTDERIVQRSLLRAPEGDMECETTYYRADPPTPTEKLVKDLAAEFPKVRHLFPLPISYRTDTAQRQKALLGERHAFGACVGYPGFQSWMCWTEGGVAPLAYAEMDCPHLLAEIREMQERQCLRQMEMILDSKLFDYVLLGGSGSLTLASPELFDKYALPTITKLTRMARQAGVATMLHSCGREWHILKRCAEETDLDCINPLEEPPMGDVNLAEAKRLYGDKLALMGNLHTTDVMLKGSVEDVRRAARACLDAAARGGGFILSTGDQCGRDTPVENIWALVEIAEEYGRY